MKETEEILEIKGNREIKDKFYTWGERYLPQLRGLRATKRKTGEKGGRESK